MSDNSSNEKKENEVLEEEQVVSEDVLEKEVNLLKDKLLRNTAELENFKRRTNEEKHNFMKYANQNLMYELIDVLDNFERAIDSVDENSDSTLVGIKMIYNQLKTVLSTNGVEVIESVGSVFDASKHQAVMQGNDENFDSQVVIEELQKGYMFKDKVLRPAMVKVNE